MCRLDIQYQMIVVIISQLLCKIKLFRLLTVVCGRDNKQTVKLAQKYRQADAGVHLASDRLQWTAGAAGAAVCPECRVTKLRCAAVPHIQRGRRVPQRGLNILRATAARRTQTFI